ncbi:hypothetical protein [Micromonospora sp. CPCC 206061]|uniref:hypothetical protein n=1 Tax=Micromonospora sp. CPCC 206061 TaxID=3122410 RepID=UPI002FF252E3
MLTDALDGARAIPGRGCMLGNTATEVRSTDDDARRTVLRAFGDLEAGIDPSRLSDAIDAALFAVSAR